MNVWQCLWHLILLLSDRNCDSFPNRSQSARTMKKVINAFVTNVCGLQSITAITRWEANSRRTPTTIRMRANRWAFARRRLRANSTTSRATTPKSTCIWRSLRGVRPSHTWRGYTRLPKSSRASAPLARRRRAPNWPLNCCRWTHRFRSKWCPIRPFYVIYYNFYTNSLLNRLVRKSTVILEYSQ